MKQSTRKSSQILPCVGDIVCLSTTNNERHIGQIIEIRRQTAKVLCQDRVYSQPISFLSPLYTEQDEGKSLNSLIGTDDTPGMALTDAFGNDGAGNLNWTHTQSQDAQTNKDLTPL